MRDSMAEALGQYDIQCEVTASANEEGTALVEADVKLSMDGEPVEVKLQMSESLDYLRLDLNAGGEAAALVFAVTENSEDALAFRFSVLSGEDEDAVVYTQDKKTQTFDVSMVETVSGQTTTTTVSGHYVVEENLLSLVVDTLDGQDMGGSVIEPADERHPDGSQLHRDYQTDRGGADECVSELCSRRRGH